MTLRILGKRLDRRVLTVLTVCGLCAATATAPAMAAAPPLPVKILPGLNMKVEPNPNTPDPGVLLDDGHFYAFSTSTPGSGTGTPPGPGLLESVSTTAAGPWTGPVNVLDPSQAMPGWIDSSLGIWAPDMIKTTSGKYVVYFSAALSGPPDSTSDVMPAAGDRCIGTAESDYATKDFKIDPNPLVCLQGYGAADDMPSDPSDNRVADKGVIDASPVFVTIDGAQELFLVYKTQGLPATIRMVRLADDDGVSVVGTSHQLVYSTSETIEAPSLIQNGSYFILFVAHGDFQNCTYSTEWYKSQHIWSWTNTGSTTLLDMSDTGGLCGPGGADVSASEVSGQDRIFFHGWVKDGTTNTPGLAALGAPPAIRVMYAAVLTFASDGFTPVIGAYQGQ
jgi:arabinan endo-1,5-alpha-L-arabinosidase